MSVAGFAKDDYEEILKAYRPIAERAGTDIPAAITMLRNTQDLAPEFLHLTFDNLDMKDHYRLLMQIIADEELANRFVFDSSTLIPDFSSLPPTFDKADLPSITRVMVAIRNQSVTALLKSVPEEISVPLVIPALWSEFNSSNIAIGIIALATESVPAAKDRHEVLITELNREIPKDEIPARFHEVVELIYQYTLITPHENPQARQNKVTKRIQELIIESNYPLSVRMGFAGMATFNLSAPLPVETNLQIGSWLAEAWETGVPEGTSRGSAILPCFMRAESHPDWNGIANRLIKSWPGKSESIDNTYSWIVGIAAALGEREKARELLAALPESKPRLSSDPLLPLLVRAGFHEAAVDQVSRRNAELLGIWSPELSRYKGVFYDEDLESNLPTFLAGLSNSEVGFITELRLKNIDDDKTHPPKTDRETRIRAMADRLAADKLPTPKAQLTALRIIGSTPKAAAGIADIYLRYAQFDRVGNHLGNVMRAREWISLCGDTLRAVVAAGRYDDAGMILEKVAEATARRGEHSFESHYHDTWETIMNVLSERLKSPVPPPAEFLSLSVKVSSLPESCFSPTLVYQREKLLRKTVVSYSRNGLTTEWWQTYETFEAAPQRAIITVMIRHVLGQTRVREPSEEAEGFEGQSKEGEELARYLKFTDIFTQVPFTAPVEDRIAAFTKAAGAQTPAAIAVVSQFSYFTDLEVLEHADSLAAALPAESSRKWSDLAQVAFNIDRQELAKTYMKRADELRQPD